MKKLSLFSMAVIMLLFVNCKKDDSSDSDENAKKPVPVTVTTTMNSPIVSPLELNGLLNDIVLNKHKNSQANSNTTNYEYDGRLITKETVTSGSDTQVKEYYYKDRNKGLLDSIVISTNGNYGGKVLYTISNDQIQAKAFYDANNNLVEKYEYSNFNGQKPSILHIYNNSAQGALDVSGDMVYTGDNLTSMNLTGTFAGFNLTIAMNMTYDNKHLPVANVETVLDVPIYVNNALSSEAVVTMPGISTVTTTSTSTYQYNSDDYPVSSNFTITQGTNSETGTTEVVYEDK